MNSKTIKDVCPELEYEKGLGIYLDVERGNIWSHPDEAHSTHLKQVVKFQDCFNFVVIGGSTGVTKENASELSTLLQQCGYDKRRIGLLPPTDNVLSDNYGFVVVPSLLNSRYPYYRYEFTRIVKPQIDELAKAGVVPIYMAYLLVEPADQLSVGKVTNPDIIRSDDYEKVAAYCREAASLGFRTISLEAGSGAKDHVAIEIVRTARANFAGDITVGGGIRTADQISSILTAGADLVTLGDVLEKSENLEQLLLEFKKAITRANKR
jgi:putative glycerol-1-phosphate prenyltransferase